MKVTVLKEFKDKHTGKMYKVGDVLAVSKDRYNEICTKGKLVEEIKTETKEKPKKAE